ncbi:MAG: TdeIII family type II restriction endonuclease [bacterium]
MSLSNRRKLEIENVLKNSLRHKFRGYNPEPASMPFHMRLLGQDRMALFSFIHSLNTNFGTSIFEPVALELGKVNFKKASVHQVSGDNISEAAEFWDFLGGTGTYTDLLDCFERVGVELRSEIDEYFKKFLK